MMTKKLKLALAALLGFSAACSTVKNAPSKGQTDPRPQSDTATAPAWGTGDRPRIVAMYGVRTPRADSLRRSRFSEVDPVAERPEPDSLSEAVGTKPADR
ncbi:hypothetical protein [Alistipes sp.]|uniref:hypothetical protein n=1 Tax=Alistipes sp. TaxID=1872444 RepID=UPI003AEFA331